MFCFLETDIKEQKKYEKRMQTSVDNTVNDLLYEIMFENIRDVRNIAFFFQTKIYFILGDIFFKVPKNLILGIFLLRQILNNKDMPRQKPQMLHW